MASKIRNNVVELNKIQYIDGNNSINFTATVIGNGAPIADVTAGVYANGAFSQANAAFSSANNVAPQVQPAFDTANAAFIKANNVYNANTTSNSFFAIPSGNTAQRPASPANGAIRFNTTIGAGEMYFEKSGWASFVGEPLITEVTPQTFNGTSGTSFEITGVRFDQDAQIYFVAANGTSYLAGSTAFYSSSRIVANTPRPFTVAYEPLSVRIVQNSGTHIKENIIDCGGVPSWITTAGNLGSIFGANTVNVYVSATDPDGNAISYSITSGSLPTGLTLTSANGLIQGLNPGATTNTTYNFTITATDSVNNTDRAFNYIILNRPPLWNTASSLSTITDDDIPSYVANTTVNAYDPDGGSVTYTLTSGSLPTGMTLVSANGALAGPITPVGSNTTSTFTVTVTDVGSLTNTRTFTLTITAPPADENFANTSLLLHGDGTNGANNNLFVDNSGNALTVTRNGNPAQGTFTPFSADAGKWSTFFTKSNTTYLELPNGSVNVGANDFSIECWLYPLDRSGASTMFGGNTNRATAEGSSITFTLTNSNGYIECTAWIGGGAVNLYSPAIPLNTWTHAVFCRTGSSMSLFVNGTRVATSTSAGGSAVNNGASTYNPAIGANGAGNADNFNGYISNFRMIIGAGVYDATASTITMPTSPLTAVTNTRVLACQDNRFIDRSTNVYAITPSGNPSVQPFSPFTPNAAYTTANTGGSVYFDGNGDYLSLASSTAFSWGSGDFSMEAWVYPTAGGLIRMFDSDTAVGFLTFLNTPNTFGFYAGNGNFYESASETMKQYAWNHCVVASVGGALRLFVNGILVVYQASGGASTSSARTCGVGSVGTQPWNGYMANVRLVKGGIPSLYSTASTTVGAAIFTPPTIPFTGSESLTGGTVSLLLNNTNAGIIDHTAKTVWETVGSSAISTAQSKFGGSAMYFDGTTNSRITSKSNVPPSNFNMGTGNYTIEFWMHSGTPASQQCLIDFRNADTSGQGIAINYRTDRTLAVYMQADRIISSAISANTWTHVAVVRSSGTYSLYINGVSAGTWANADAVVPPANRPIIGAVNDGSQMYVGYIDELRITKGVARYTTTFTPATKAFSDK